MKHFLFFILISCGYLGVSKGIITDKESVINIKKGLDHTYNYEFRSAERYFDKIKAKHPNHPAYYLLEAIKMNLEYPQLVADESELYKKFQYQITTSIKLSNLLLKTNEDDLEGIFFKMTALSLLGLKHSQAKQYSKAMNIAKSTYDYVKKAMKFKDQFHEFYFTSGLYNYYIVQYPESHPVIKPFMIFFQNGNKALGLKELEYASLHTNFSEAECYSFLSDINFKYEFNINTAYEYAKKLNVKFPKNSLYQFKLCEIALMKHDLKTAKLCLDSIKHNKGTFYQAAYLILNGSYHEKINATHLKIKHYYNEGLAVITKNKMSSMELSSIAYMGLARCYDHEKDIDKAKYYYKLAIDATSNKYYEQEASEYLKLH